MLEEALLSKLTSVQNNKILLCLIAFCTIQEVTFVALILINCIDNILTDAFFTYRLDTEVEG